MIGFTTVARPASEGFESAAATSVDLDEQKLQKFIKTAEKMDSGALLILRKNKLVAEKYWHQAGPDSTIPSVSKFLVSLAVGRLIGDGFLREEDLASKWFNSWSGEKTKITIRHLLTHTSGLQENTEEMEKSKNQLKYSRELPLSTPPGEDYFCSEAGTLLLSEIVHQVSGLTIDKFVEQRFFTPLNIRQATWKKDRSGTVLANEEISLTPQELAKIGVLLLQNGRWQESSLVSADFLEKARKPSRRNTSHGYLLHLIPQGFFATGRNGQFLIVLPKQEMVIVRLRTPAPEEEIYSKMQWLNMPNEVSDFISKKP